MKNIKTYLAAKFETLYYFYRFIGYKVFLLLIFNFLSVLLDSIGLAMFIPLLQVADNNVGEPSDANSDLIFYTTRVFDFFHLPMNIGVMLGFIVLLFVLKGLVTYFTLFYQSIVMQTFIKKLRIKNSLGLSALSFKEFVSSDVGRLQNTLTGEANSVVESCRSYIETIRNSMVVVVYLGFAFLLDWKFSLLVVVGGLLSNLIYKAFYAKTKSLSRENNKYSHEYSGLVIQSVNNFKYLKATQRNELFNKRMLNVLDLSIDNAIRSGRLGAMISSIREPVMILVICVVIAFQVMVFQAPLSSVLIILVLFYRAMAYIMSVQATWNQYLVTIGSLENMRAFEKYLIDFKEPNLGEHTIESIDNVELKDIHLSYGKSKILDGINLKLHKRSSIAFVGETGSGKSTLINVISGLLNQDQGQIIINGENRSNLDLFSFRSRIGYVSQDSTIFSSDIFDNVTFWAERSPENLEKFWKALEASSLFDFVNKLPNKEAELLGNNGLNLSGGQKQRISIARELYRDVDLLILDEATSALDSQTEKEIKESIENLKGSLTIISIAHRLSTIMNADEIYLLKEGKIVASGPFTALKERSPYFKKLAELQGL